jgi:hypothetical protein
VETTPSFILCRLLSKSFREGSISIVREVVIIETQGKEEERCQLEVVCIDDVKSVQL